MKMILPYLSSAGKLAAIRRYSLFSPIMKWRHDGLLLVAKTKAEGEFLCVARTTGTAVVGHVISGGVGHVVAGHVTVGHVVMGHAVVIGGVAGVGHAICGGQVGGAEVGHAGQMNTVEAVGVVVAVSEFESLSTENL